MGARLALELGDYETAPRRFGAILDRVRKEQGEDTPETATASNNLALIHRSLGRNGEAEPLYKMAIAIGEKILPADHPALSPLHSNLAALHQAQGRLGEAELLYRRALEILERQLGPGHPSTGAATVNLADVLKRQGHSDEADILMKRIGGR